MKIFFDTETVKVSMLIDRLKELNTPIYSYSKLGSVAQCKYAAYLTYIEKEKGDDNVYGYLGSIVHNLLEEIQLDKKTVEEAKSELDTIITQLDITKLYTFPNQNIKKSYIENIKHFFNNFTKLEGNYETEKHFLIKMDNGIFLQGFIDLIKYNDDGTIDIYDWKTSSMFTSKTIDKAGLQLILYGLALELSGYQINKIAWNMLKYCDIEYMGYKRKDSRNKTLNIKKGKERRKIDEHIPLSAEAENILVKNHIKYYEYNDENKKKLIEYINKQASLFDGLSIDNSPISINERNKFFCYNLCNHRKNCPYLAKFTIQNKDNYIKKVNDNDIWSLLN